MTDLKATPGPWRDASPYGQPGTIVDRDGVCIAQCPISVDVDRRANARLIAASHDLYAALRSLIEQLAIGNRVLGVTRRDDDLMQAGFAALDKARGEQA